jgi:hypothetical protein
MEPRDRRISLALFALAAASWIAVAAIVLTVDPVASPGPAHGGAVALGLAVALMTAPVIWLVGFARHRRIAYRGDWLRALRRAAWIGLLVAVFVVMRLNGIFQPQIGLFLVALALVAEISLTAGSPNRG